MTISICQNLEEVRDHIDRIDRQIVALLAQRGAYVRQAAQFKTSRAEVEAPARVAQVIAKVRALAEELGANPDLTERVYREMIDGFIREEMAAHAGQR